MTRTWIAVVVMCSFLSQGIKVSNSLDPEETPMIGVSLGCTRLGKSGGGLDYFTLTLQWPRSACVKGVDEGKTCKIPEAVKYWTIHGLWPQSRSGGEVTANCSKTPFDESKIKSLESELDAYWPNIYPSPKEPTSSFWQHEWDVHGRCSASVPTTSSEYKYFSTALSVRRKYDIDRYLKQAKILPSSNRRYSSADVERAITKQLNVNPIVRCFWDKRTRRHLLFEVQICMDKGLKLISCHTRKLTESLKLFRPWWRKTLPSSACPPKDIYYLPI